jgi:hypothetical protein
MDGRRWRYWAWLLLASLAGQASAAGAATPVCRRGGVEWIVGGREAPRPACEAATAAKPDPGGTAASTAARWRESDGAAERRRILEDELRHEQAALARALGQGAAADPAALGRTRANISALQGELSRLPPAR